MGSSHHTAAIMQPGTDHNSNMNFGPIRQQPCLSVEISLFLWEITGKTTESHNAIPSPGNRHIKRD